VFCAMEAGKSAGTCWCMAVDRVSMPERADVGDICLCRACLKRAGTSAATELSGSAS
jgi:hypothetical protein